MALLHACQPSTSVLFARTKEKGAPSEEGIDVVWDGADGVGQVLPAGLQPCQHQRLEQLVQHQYLHLVDVVAAQPVYQHLEAW